MPLAKPIRGLQALRNEGLATLKQPIIPGFPSPSCGRGFKPMSTLILKTLLPSITMFSSPYFGRRFYNKDAFGKTQSWAASPEERRDGDPETTDNFRVSIPFLRSGI